MAKPSDVEIFLRGVPVERVVAWLTTVAGAVTVAFERDGVVGYTTERGPAVWTARMEDGPFDGLWLPWGKTVWADDLACARAAAAALGGVVRCEPPVGYPGADPDADEYVELSGGAERRGAWADDPA